MNRTPKPMTKPNLALEGVVKENAEDGEPQCSPANSPPPEREINAMLRDQYAIPLCLEISTP